MLSNSAFALSLPGITPSGAPAFGNSVKVSLNPNNGRLKATGRKNFLLDTGSGVLSGTSGAYSLQVDFDKQDQTFLGGSVSLKGAIDAFGIGKNTLLMSADITGFNILNDNFLWGFNTTNIFCDPILEAAIGSCTSSESVYIELDSAFSGLFQSNFRTTGFATTTIPVPAAAWLFGSALGLLGWVRRRTLLREIITPTVSEQST
jgi:hypothetical protein